MTTGLTELEWKRVASAVRRIADTTPAAEPDLTFLIDCIEKLHGDATSAPAQAITRPRNDNVYRCPDCDYTTRCRGCFQLHKPRCEKKGSL